jgi:hypothetical protein
MPSNIFAFQVQTFSCPESSSQFELQRTVSAPPRVANITTLTLFLVLNLVCARRRQSNLLVVRFGFQPVAFQQPTVAFHRTPGWVARTEQRPQVPSFKLSVYLRHFKPRAWRWAISSTGQKSTTSHPSSPKWLDRATTHETRTDRMRGRHLRSPGGPCRVDVNVWWKFIVAFYNELEEDRLERNSNVGGTQGTRQFLFTQLMP